MCLCVCIYLHDVYIYIYTQMYIIKVLHTRNPHLRNNRGCSVALSSGVLFVSGISKGLSLVALAGTTRLILLA